MTLGNHWKFSWLLRSKLPGSAWSLVIRCDSNILEHQLVWLSHKALVSLWSSGFLFSEPLWLIIKLLEEVSCSLSNIICHYQMCGFSRESPVIGQVLPTHTNGCLPYCIIIGAWEDTGYFSWECHWMQSWVDRKANKQGQESAPLCQRTFLEARCHILACKYCKFELLSPTMCCDIIW